jgi:hypothetical protein
MLQQNPIFIVMSRVKSNLMEWSVLPSHSTIDLALTNGLHDFRQPLALDKFSLDQLPVLFYSSEFHEHTKCKLIYEILNITTRNFVVEWCLRIIYWLMRFCKTFPEIWWYDGFSRRTKNQIKFKKIVAWPQVNFLWTFSKYKAFIQKILFRNWKTYQLSWFQKIKTCSDCDRNQNDFKLILASWQKIFESNNTVNFF